MTKRTSTHFLARISNRILAPTALAALALGSGCATAELPAEDSQVRIQGVVSMEEDRSFQPQAASLPSSNSPIQAASLPSSNGPSSLQVVIGTSTDDNFVMVESPDGTFDVVITDDEFSLCIFDDGSPLGCLSDGTNQVFSGHGVREINLGTLHVNTGIQLIEATEMPQPSPSSLEAQTVPALTTSMQNRLPELGGAEFAPAA